MRAESIIDWMWKRGGKVMGGWMLLSGVGTGSEGLIHEVDINFGNMAVALALGFGRCVPASTYRSRRRICVSIIYVRGITILSPLCRMMYRCL